METKVIDRDGYRFVVTKTPVVKPEGTIHIQFTKELLDEEGVIEWASKYDMFLDEEELRTLKEAL